MALTFTKELGKYVIGGLTGTGITLAALLAWTGAEDLQAIKSAVASEVNQSNEFSSQMATDYFVDINKANAEISDYQKALEEANANIRTLVTAYEEQQAEIDGMLTEAEANEIIAKANAEIQQANEQVAETKEAIERTLSDSYAQQVQNTQGALSDQESKFNELKNYVANGQMSEEEFKEFTGMGTDEFNGDTSVNTGGDKTVADLPTDLQQATEPQE